MDQHLLTFITVTDKQSFTKAAEHLHLTQSAVSLEIKNLEAKYGVKLLDRSNKFVRLTKAGEILYAHAKEILALHERAIRMIDDLSSNASGPLAIGSSYTFGEYALPKIVAKFILKHPNITPNITIRNTKRIIEQVLKKDIDVGIIEGTASHSDIIVNTFTQDEMTIIIPPEHRLAKMQEASGAELESETWILREKGSGTREMTNRVFQEMGISPSSIMEFGSSQTIKEAVENGLGISVISNWVIKKEVDYGLLVPLRIKGKSFKRDIAIVTHISQINTKATDLFIDFLRSSVVD
ncbi:cysJI operon transcriptional regulator CysL [Bacillus carboniphilus]|uniref:CysJI operon transcriptional regulator CysL n=1 Tax=Bacillus carboniphilus TaxID=86663 RepID=A0ABP3FW26_9BACI